MNEKFHKMHGCGNDFVIMGYTNLHAEDIQLICDRKYGVGCDQLILLKYDDAQSDLYDCEMIIFNSDSTIANFCGNGLRCVGKLLFSSEKFQNKKELKIKSGEKIVRIWKEGDFISTNISSPKYSWREIPFSSNNLLKDNLLIVEKYHNVLGGGFCVNVGNPHIVFFVKNFDFDYEEIGSEISNMNIFPEKINVNFAQILNDKEILLQTYERGSGLTIACGSGSCATFICAYKQKLINNDSIKIHFLKGRNEDFLKISCNENEEILMTGPATSVFEGRFKEKIEN